MRFTTSGTETTWHAVRVARGYTGRAHVIRFEGHFHGFNDTLAFSSEPPLDEAGPADAPHAVVESAGVPPEAGAHVTVVPFNDAGALERAVLAHRRRPGGGDPGADQLRLLRDPARSRGSWRPCAT